MTYPDFTKKFQKIQYAVIATVFPSVAIFTIFAFFLINMNFDNDYERTESFVSIINNTHIGIENLMIENCEQDAQINALLGFEVPEIENQLTDCLNSIPFINPPSGIEVEINEGNGEA